MAIQRISSKWAKTKVLLRSQQVSAFIPLTLKYSQDALSNLLVDHTLVYIKPDKGTYGNGVMCVDRFDQEAAVDSSSRRSKLSQTSPYRLRYQTVTEYCRTIDELHSRITAQTKNNLYLIQQGIVLLQYHGRSFDLRILTQKTPYGTWETTGIIGRVAAKNKIVTNYHNGGTVGKLNELLAEHATPAEIARLERKLYDLGEWTAQQMQKEYPRLKEIGLDIALDENLYPWILEVNTLPAIFPFKKFFKDKNVYQRIEKYAIAYGRLSPKKNIKATGNTSKKSGSL
ncbi:YheC/YheD family protein [Paenibacillus pini]|uniref:ATP-grasp domain-containing protein n=1 Tax=Paenibacillus pini JCM 16418 TaxID=1236976 RepID=W7YUG5_9BACL|nr:YheC/YheD family protein [Paenibacillus pini]GAF08221.1 hypothetical protein JCM16418_2279 [Paenibacillus pini JCM 16418]